MNCVYCGSEIKDGNLFCSKCGKEARIVPDYNVYDEDFLNMQMNEDANAHASLDEEEEKNRKAREEKIRKQKLAKEQEQLKKQKQMRIIIIASIAAVLCVVALIAVLVVNITLSKERSGSFVYQVQCGKDAYKEGDLEKAISYYEAALELDEEDIDVRLDLVDLYIEAGDYNAGIVLCSEILKLDAGNEGAYKKLIKIYALQDDYDAIEELASTVTDAEILELFEDYIVTQPVSNYESGTYDDFIEVELSAPSGYTIYYTTSSDDPTGSRAIEYTEPIALDTTGTHKIHAVCLNDLGIYSEVLDLVIEIDLAAPVTPYFSSTGDGLDDAGEVLEGAFYIASEDEDDTTAGDSSENAEDTSSAPIVMVNVPENCVCYYEWDNSSVSVLSELYNAETGIEVPSGDHTLYLIYIDQRTDKCSTIKSRPFTYIAE